MRYQNPACQRLFPDIGTLGLKHPLFTDWVKVLKELQAMKPGQPVIREISVGNSVYEQTYFLINKKQIRIYGRDITKRQHAEQALQSAQAILRASHDNSPLGIRVVSEDGKNLYANKAILDIFGYDSMEDFNKIPFSKMYTPESNAQGLLRDKKRERGERTLFNYEIGIIRKDGAIRYLQAFRSVVIWEGKQEYQTIYIDITAHKNTESVLKSTEENLRKLNEQSTLGIRIVGKDGKNVFANRAVLNMFGYASVEEFETIPIKNRYTPESYANSEMRFERQRRGEPVADGWEVSVVRKDGEVRHLQVFRGEVLWEGQLHDERLYLDVTNHKNAEQALLATEENFRNSIENSPIGIRIVAEDGETLYINRALLDLYGYQNLEEFNKTPARSRYTPKSYLEFNHRRERRLRREPLPNEYEVSIICKDGTVRHLQVFRKAVLWGGKRQYQALYIDITERKQMITRINDLNDVLQLVTNINQLIVEIDNESELLQKACEQFIKSRQYRLAWFGFKQEDSYDILPCAMSSEDTSYLSSVRITWDDSPLGQGPTGIAIKTGKACVVRDILHDPRFEPWRDEALSRGFKSMVALPIVIQNKVLGTLGIYSLFTDAFDRKELDLLTELAGDLSLGIEKIRRREEHALIEQALRQERDRAQAYLNIAGVILIIWDIKERVALVNRRGCEILGYESSEIIGKIWHANFLPKNKRKEAADYFNHVVAGEIEPNRQYENQVLTKDGQERTISWNSIELRDGKGKIIGLLSSGEDITERKKAEEELKVSEQNFRNSLDSSLMSICILDEEQHALYANQVFLDMLGYKNIDEVSTTALQDHYTPEEYARYLLRQERRLRGEVVPIATKVDIIGNNGSIRHLEISANEVLWNGKKESQLLYHDIIELKQAETALKESEEKYRLIVENSRDIIFTLDSAGRLLYVSPSIRNVLGYNPTDLIGQPFRTIIHPEDLLTVVESIRRNVNEGIQTPEGIEFRARHISGDWRWQNGKGNVVHDADGKFLNFIGVARDIAESKKVAEALRESEEKYRLIVENSRDLIFTLDTQGNFIYLSPSVTQLLGYSQTELRGKPFASLVHPDDLPIIEEAISHMDVDGNQSTGSREYRFRHASGEWRWHVSGGTRTQYTGGVSFSFIGLARDVTEFKQTEDERRQLEEKSQVASRLAAMGEMAAGIAHEINNPLTGVLGYSQIMLARENVPEDVKGDLRVIADSSQRVAEIVKRLLTFAGQDKPVKSLVNLNELIDNTLKLRDYVLKTANITVVTQFDRDLPLSVVDPGQLQQVFLNLIVNAEQAMREAHGKGILTITTKKQDNNIRISFQDDGPGITEQNRAHLFEPFFTTKAPGEGTGLGLSLSRSIITAHDGNMTAESEPSHGATFIIELPFIEGLSSVAGVSNQTIKVKPATTKNGKLLVVDDESVVRGVLHRVLTRMGHSVETIADARIAMEKIGAGVMYDVILTDVRMPGMSGIEMYTRIVEKMPAMKNKIIFITGDVMGADIKNFLTQNNLAFLAKPFDIESLQEKISAIMNSGRPENDISGGSDT